MKTRIMKFLPAVAAIALATLAFSQPASAAVEQIDWGIVLDQPIEQYFPNEVHPDFPKLLKFEGTVENPTDTDGALVMFFDWVDIDDPSIVYTSDPVTIPLGDGDLLSVNITETIPFCPPQVSLHARTADAPLLELVGTFTHECLVPEPTSALSAALGLIGIGLAAARRRS
jgi:MYXO-CTERM domain-containing protein